MIGVPLFFLGQPELVETENVEVSTSQVSVDWSSFNSASISQDTPGSLTPSAIYHAVSFNNAVTYKVFKTTWQTVAYNNGGTWQYNNAGTLTNASTNSLAGALTQSTSSSNYQWTKANIEVMTATDWSASNGWSSSVTKLDWATVSVNGSSYVTDGSTNPNTTKCHPNMTGDSMSSGGYTYVTSSNTVTQSGYEAYRAFDGSTGTLWKGARDVLPAYVQLDFGSGNSKCINKFRFYGLNFDFPDAVSIQGSQNGLDWSTFQSWSDIPSDSDWYPYFTFSNGNSFRYYRVNVTDAPDQGAFRELELVEAQTSSVSPTFNYVLINYTPSNLVDVKYLVIAGGGGGASSPGAAYYCGGGGSGGYRCNVSGESSGGGASAESALSLSENTAHTITVGAGGVADSNGYNSVFASVVSLGGGYGGYYIHPAASGGSGGGGITPGSGTSGQGYGGGTLGWLNGPGGGGGSGSIGGNGSSGIGGIGGNGISSSITGSTVTRGGGGGAESWGVQSSGGSGGGGNGGSRSPLISGTSGNVNTGGGGGGKNGGAGLGGSGLVVIKIPNTHSASFSAGVTYTTITSVSGYNIYNVTATSTVNETVTFFRLNVGTDYATPVMTSNTAPSGYRVLCSTTYGGYPAYYAFDQNLTTSHGWRSANQAAPHWISFDFGSGNEKVIDKFAYVGDTYGSPKSWVLQGSNVEDFSTKTDLYERSNVADPGLGWTEYFYFLNTIAYRYYRLYISATYNDLTNTARVVDLKFVSSS